MLLCFLNQFWQVPRQSSIFWMLVVARRLPSAVLEDTVLQVSRFLARLVFTLLMSLPLNFLADLRELDLLPEKIRITVLSVFEKIARLRHGRAVELESAYQNCVPRSFVAKVPTIFCRAAAPY